MSYARVLIEVDVSKPLPQAILVEDEEGHVHDQDFFIEWVPHFCQKYQFLGHMCDESSQVPKNIQTVKAGKKYIPTLSFVPKQGTVELIVNTRVASRKSLADTSTEEERELVDPCDQQKEGLVI